MSVTDSPEPTKDCSVEAETARIIRFPINDFASADEITFDYRARIDALIELVGLHEALRRLAAC